MCPLNHKVLGINAFFLPFSWSGGHEGRNRCCVASTGNCFFSLEDTIRASCVWVSTGSCKSSKFACFCITLHGQENCGAEICHISCFCFSSLSVSLALSLSFSLPEDAQHCPKHVSTLSSADPTSKQYPHTDRI